MKNCFYFFLLCLTSCQLDSSEKTSSSNDVFKLGMSPEPSAQYAYNIENETSLETDVNGKEVQTKSKSEIGVNYVINKDSSGNYLVSIGYDKVVVQTKTGDQESELNAENAAISANPAEKILGYLKEAKLRAVLNAKGETKEVHGYEELGEKVLSGFAANDTYGKAMAQKQWEGMMRQQLVDNNLKQMFTFFPDSLVRVGEKWTTKTQLQDQFTMNVTNTYVLKSIGNNIATIIVQGKIETDKTSRNLTGAAMAADLQGEQEGFYKIDLLTGMPIHSEMKATTEGKMMAMGREVPVSLQNKVIIKRRD